MPELEEFYQQIYEKECKKCGKPGLIPLGHTECLNCLKETFSLKPWETICLQCGKKVSHLPREHKICLDCLDKNFGNSKGKLVNSLNPDQKKLWKAYVIWDDFRSSFIILMS